VLEAQPQRARPGQVTEHVDPLVQVQPQRVVALHLTHDAVLRRFAFLDEGAEQSVVDDEHATVVAVDVLGIAPMVGTVVGRGVEQPLDGSGQLADPLGVQEVLIGQAHRKHEQNPLRGESQPDQWQIEQPVSGEAIEQALAHGRREIHVPRGVMHHVGGPEPANTVAGPVKEEKAELQQEEQQDKSQRSHLELQQAMFEKQPIDRQHQDRHQHGIHHQVEASQPQAGQRVTEPKDPAPT